MQEHVGKHQSLVQEAAGIVAQVENQPVHAAGEQPGPGGQEFLGRGAGEFREAYVARGVVHHEGRVDRMGGNLPASDFEGDGLVAALHGHRDLGARLALHPAYHAVLRELHSRYHGGVHLDEPVAWLEPYLLRRAARNHLDHHGGVVGHVELYAYPVEVAGQVSSEASSVRGSMYTEWGSRAERAAAATASVTFLWSTEST